MQTFLLLGILLGFAFKDSFSSQELTIRVNKKMELAREGIDVDTNREKRDSRYREVSDKVRSLLTAADYLDDQISMLEDSLVETVETARATMTAARGIRSWLLSISYIPKHFHQTCIMCTILKLLSPYFTSQYLFC